MWGLSDCLGRLAGDTNKEQKLEMARGYAIYSLRGFGKIPPIIGVVGSGVEIEGDLRRQSSSRNEILFRRGIRAPNTTRMCQASTEYFRRVELGGKETDASIGIIEFKLYPLGGNGVGRLSTFWR